MHNDTGILAHTEQTYTAPLPSTDYQPIAGPGAGKSHSAFRTISEVADILGVQQHVLRFWETKFSQIKPLKRGGGRRYYRPEDVDLLRSIHHLLYTQGYTIRGVQKLIRDGGKRSVREVAATAPPPVNSNTQSAAADVSYGLTPDQRKSLQSLLAELKTLRAFVISDTL